MDLCTKKNLWMNLYNIFDPFDQTLSKSISPHILYSSHVSLFTLNLNFSFFLRFYELFGFFLNILDRVNKMYIEVNGRKFSFFFLSSYLQSVRIVSDNGSFIFIYWKCWSHKHKIEIYNLVKWILFLKKNEFYVLESLIMKIKVQGFRKILCK